MSDNQLKEAKAKRSGCGSWLSRASKVCDNLADNVDSLDDVSYENALKNFEVRLEAWDDAQRNVELLVPDETDLDAEVNAAAEYRERCESSKLKLQRMWRRIGTVSTEESQSVVRCSMKLPKLESPKFSGDVLKFMPFWQQFLSCVDSQDIDNITKFNYLLSSLKGEAKQCLDGLSVTSENYEEAKQIVNKRYGRSELIIFSHVQVLLALQTPSLDVDSLVKFRDKLTAHVRSLDALGVNSSKYGIILTPIVVARLPEEMRLEWSRSSSGKEADLDHLMSFLEEEVGRRERSKSFSTTVLQQALPKHSTRRAPGTASALFTDSRERNNTKSCGFCSKNHDSSSCHGFLKKPVKKRVDMVRESGVCFRCLSGNHLARDCLRKCAKCDGNHHKSLCYGPKNRTTAADAGASTSDQDTEQPSAAEATNLQASSVQVHSTVSFLPIASVIVVGQNGKSSKVTLLFDSGADKSYVSSKVVNRLCPKFLGKTQVTFSAFGGSVNHSHSKTFELKLKGRNGCELFVNATEVPVICAPLSRPVLDSETFSAFQHLDLANDFEDADDGLSIDLLIGLDQFWAIMYDEVYRAEEGGRVVAQRSKLWWVLSGSVIPQHDQDVSSPSLLNLSDIPSSVIRSFWDLESIGVKDSSDEKDPVLTAFEESIKFNPDSGRYCVQLPWKSNPPELLSNYQSALSQLNSLNKRLEKQPDLRAGYDAALREMETNGHIVEVHGNEIDSSENPIFYLPHHPHVRESAVSTKIRPVFNASAKASNGVSLNDCLEKGPNLNPTVMELLMRFRRWNVAVVADIKKAFLQIELDERDQDVHRFLWRVGGRIRVMKFVRVTFGVNCSPFLLSATIQHHLRRCPPSVVVKELLDSMYVDDVLSGANSVTEAQDLYRESGRVMNAAGMSLAKWNSNKTTVFEPSIEESQPSSEGYTKVLGVSWSPENDCLSFGGMDLPLNMTCTKRVVLSVIARIFDPLGLVLPFTVTAKFLFQDVWRLGIDWDDVLPKDLEESFVRWLQGIEALKDVSIPRQYFDCNWSTGVDVEGLELHAFGDASLRGYGACVYLKRKLPSGTVTTSLVKSCARVAPLERKTLPRLELLGCLVEARLLKSVIETLRLPSNIRYTCWTDSMIALGWIKGQPSKWKPFVANRVTEIQSLTDPSAWRHVNGEENPADLVTRGVTAGRLVESSLWWNGPNFLRSLEPCAITESVSVPVPEENPDVQGEIKVSSNAALVSIGSPPFDVERWSSLSKAYRVIATSLAFIRILRARVEARRTSTGYSTTPVTLRSTAAQYTSDDYAMAKTMYLKMLQMQYFPDEIAALKSGRNVSRVSVLLKLSPYLDQDGLLRVKGRIQLSNLSFESKHPVILPRCRGTLLFIRFVHCQQKHLGVDSLITFLRGSYEIIGLRQMAKQVKKSCVSCQRFDVKNCNEAAAPLPSVRVTEAPAFTVTGIDCAGPIFCLDHPGDKFYICLFVCGVVRAVHLELLRSMNQEDFIRAFRKFSALKRMPSVVYSDNGSNFLAGRKTLDAYLGPLAPTWKFICPHSPWWGGWWERLVRSVKNALRKTIGRNCLTFDELQTCLYEVAAAVNSRPLTFVGTDIQNKPALTPNHFLCGQGKQSLQSVVVEDPENVSDVNLCERWQEMNERADQFWEVWSGEYVRNLPPAYSKMRKQGNISIGFVVLIRDDRLPRMRWALGIVEKLHLSSDGIPRSADLRTAKGMKRRPIQKLYNLEILDPDTAPKAPSGQMDIQDPSEPKIPHGGNQPDRPRRRCKMPSKYKDFDLKQ